ncbi:MAG TPA: PD-(D/E)XK nuclease family protein, partial [Saprospiraceae bacterium]|nr:PD-(D/E)XK nuclease family protein [Saprospiraceae bacterium]
MQKTESGYRFSATDLAKYLSCNYAIRLDKEVKDGIRGEPSFTDPHYFTVKELGLEHEKRYVQHLKNKGLKVTELKDEGEQQIRVARTIQAMHEGYDIIVQAALEGPIWNGFADILKKVPTPGKFGDWSYEVMDTKLGQETKAGAVLQLCVYSDLLTSVQEVSPKNMYIVKPGDPFDEEPLRYNDYAAFYRWIKGKLETALPSIETESKYPDPVPYCETCRWWSVCDKRRRADDHLSFVAGLHASHTKELQSQ